MDPYSGNVLGNMSSVGQSWGDSSTPEVPYTCWFHTPVNSLKAHCTSDTECICPVNWILFHKDCRLMTSKGACDCNAGL